ncbi:hypothetical protein GCM10010145_03290 [Streptomyces ruber]|uniref:Uncharacterized protein n=2 Tax=Streptomyces TaxID=1883 RepID=A0A918B6X9_9ACTN|nr:hypothetical protein GCM10010145_03290 [Streptomyces ruber]
MGSLTHQGYGAVAAGRGGEGRGPPAGRKAGRLPEWARGRSLPPRPSPALPFPSFLSRPVPS